MKSFAVQFEWETSRRTSVFMCLPRGGADLEEAGQTADDALW